MLTPVTSLREFLELNDVANATSINPSDMESELLRMASLYSRFGIIAAQARAQRDNGKTNVELTEAKLDKKLRDKFAASGEKATENKIRSELVIQPAYVAEVMRLNEANSILAAVETTLKSLEMKRDMLVQLNKNSEREYAYSSAMVPTMDAKGATDRALQALRKSS